MSEQSVKEPPGARLKENRNRFYVDISDSLWMDWKWQFRNRICDIKELERLLQRNFSFLSSVIEKYPMSITPYYFCLIDFEGDFFNDPIFLQSIPSPKELNGTLKVDPLEERRDMVVEGMVCRYADRGLVLLTDICPMLCRHCTRKREWHSQWMRTDEEIDNIIAYVRSKTDIHDVILSGGDPLTLPTKKLEIILQRLLDISHVEIVRIGSRFPVVLPYRIDEEFCRMLEKYSPVWFNTHFNHRNEITEESKKACSDIVKTGTPMNNQSVLLKGVNDTAENQMELCRELLKIKVRPYYLFQADEVSGTEHFRTPIKRGKEIINGMNGNISGLGIPHFVVDLTGGLGKVRLA
jgi:lysine 2,3-aminomutase